MKQYEQIIKMMEQLGGSATLGRLNQTIDISQWKTKTPYASIRRIVQDKNFFFKIHHGLWALNSHKEKFVHFKNSLKEKEFSHSYYQGLLLELGTVKKFETFVPQQDKNKNFLDSTLAEKRTLNEIYNFGYKEIVKRASTIDVLWFNRRKMPTYAFEIETTTNFTEAFSRYFALQDFHIEFCIIADKGREKEYKDKLQRNEFSSIKKRVKFMNTEKLSDWHSKTMELQKLGID